jgi:hypothetical protein
MSKNQNISILLYHRQNVYSSYVTVQDVSKRPLQWYSNCYTLNGFIVCTPLSIKVFVTLATQSHLEYHCKALFETPCITVEVTLNHNYPRQNSACFAIL